MPQAIHLTAIVAMTPEHIIGNNGTLPWHLPEDLAFFKKTTSGHPIVMGRKTFDSIGKPLPNRTNIVLTHDSSWSHPNVIVIHTPQALLELPHLGPRAFIIGGAEIYTAYLPLISDLLVSHVHHPYPGNTRFPEFTSHFPISEIIETHTDFTVKRWSRPS